jgi:hypothetical protein
MSLYGAVAATCHLPHSPCRWTRVAPPTPSTSVRFPYTHPGWPDCANFRPPWEIVNFGKFYLIYRSSPIFRLVFPH